MVKRRKKEVDTTRSVHRALRMGQLGFRVAGSYLGYQVQNAFLDTETRARNKKTLHRKNARRIQEEFKTLRGPIMKLGQFLSMQGHALPEEVIQELAELQMHAPPMHPSLMKTQFRRALGKAPKEVFAEFDSEPFAASSLGQVHRAVTREGKEVAVKIQYPAIRRAIQNDFKLLRTATFPARLSRYLPAGILKEAEEGILIETDYRNEARNMEDFRKRLQPLAFVRVPKPYPEYSSDRVLTMSWVEGDPLGQKLKWNPSQSWRDLIGSRLFELFFYQFLHIHALHADPHPGNYLYGKDGTIALVDFGCVKYFPDRIIRYGQAFFDRLWEEDMNAFARVVGVAFGHTIDLTREKDRRLTEMLIELHRFFLSEQGPGKAFDYGDTVLFDRMSDIYRETLKACAPDPEFFFFSRAEIGLCNVLHKLGAKVKTTQIANRLQTLKT